MGVGVLRKEAGTGGAIVALPFCHSVPKAPPPALSEAERRDLDLLRWLALKSALAPKPDLERACRLLAGDPRPSLERFAVAFFRGLSRKARRGMTFHRPGVEALSDDEVWLTRLIAAWEAGDAPAASALVAWRVRPDGRRWLRFLSDGLARALAERRVEDGAAAR